MGLDNSKLGDNDWQSFPSLCRNILCLCQSCRLYGEITKDTNHGEFSLRKRHLSILCYVYAEWSTWYGKCNDRGVSREKTTYHNSSRRRLRFSFCRDYRIEIIYG